MMRALPRGSANNIKATALPSRFGVADGGEFAIGITRGDASAAIPAASSEDTTLRAEVLAGQDG